MLSGTGSQLQGRDRWSTLSVVAEVWCREYNPYLNKPVLLDTGLIAGALILDVNLPVIVLLLMRRLNPPSVNA